MTEGAIAILVNAEVRMLHLALMLDGSGCWVTTAKLMKRVKPEMEDDLRSEYDLKSLRVRKLGSGRKSFGGTTVRLEPDVAEMFPNAEAVNEALRLMK